KTYQVTNQKSARDNNEYGIHEYLIGDTFFFHSYFRVLRGSLTSVIKKPYLVRLNR
ncbi:MAG: hypothetical protein ACD_12C00203G0001, partial [uncultured bacterium]